MLLRAAVSSIQQVRAKTPQDTGELSTRGKDHVCVCVSCVYVRASVRAPVRACVDLCCSDGLIILWTAALLVLPWMWRANKDCIKIKIEGGRRSESLRGRKGESDVVGLFYLFHFLLII